MGDERGIVEGNSLVAWRDSSFMNCRKTELCAILGNLGPLT